MSGALAAVLWPPSRLSEAVEALALRLGVRRPADAPVGPLPRAAFPLSDMAKLMRFLEAAASSLGLAAVEASAGYRDVEDMLRRAAPALLVLPGEGVSVLLSARGGHAQLLGPDRLVRRVPLGTLRDALCAPREAVLRSDAEAVLTAAGLKPRRRARALRALLSEQLRNEQVGGVWLLRLPPGASLLEQARKEGLFGLLGGVLAINVLRYALVVLGWWLLGRGVLSGRLDLGWLLGWLVAVLSLVPLGALDTYLEGLFGLTLGALLKQRLLAGTMRLEPDEVRKQGAGQFLGQVMEAATFQVLATSGALSGLLSMIEIALAVFVLLSGALLPPLALLVGFVGLALGIALRYRRHRQAWTEARRDLAHELVESMVGYRTLLCQVPRDRWYRAQDRALSGYTDDARRMDRDATALMALLPRGFLITGVLGLSPLMLADAGPARLLIGLGGVLLGYGALRRLVMGLVSLADAAVAWRQIEPVYRAAARPEVVGVPMAAEAVAGEALVEARDLHFSYGARAVLSGCNLSIRPGDRVLLEGGSGSGKTTLGALLSGLRQPDGGILLLSGLDHRTLGDAAWHRKVAAAPQFHENHVFLASLWMNLFLGYSGPNSDPTLAQEGRDVCDELGLSELIARMPGGTGQLVGECGWQLSHGEKSRLFIARALLQGADLIVLDESFGALDPETMKRALLCVRRRAKTLVVIAHP